MLKRYATTLLLSLSAISAGAMASERADEGWQRIQNGALLVDVRTPQEFKDGHLAGSVNYPLSELESHFSNTDKTQPIVVYCRSGNRSGHAKLWLVSQGFTDVHNAGGLEEIRLAKPSK